MWKDVPYSTSEHRAKNKALRARGEADFVKKRLSIKSSPARPITGE
jgi:hypothetical protein